MTLPFVHAKLGLVEDLLDALHTPSPVTFQDLSTWVDAYRMRPERSALEDAVLGGRAAGTLGLAFLSGYQAALRRLVPSLPRARLAALAVTEVGGGHPTAMTTALTHGRLRGKKTFVTLGTFAERLFVLARRSEAEPALALVAVEATHPGLVFKPLPPLPFVPEIPHAEVDLDCEIEAKDVLSGDGYLDFTKPFRTLEDLHVLIAILAQVISRARILNAPAVLKAELTAIFASLLPLFDRPPLAPSVHVSLGGTFSLLSGPLDRFGDHLRNVDAAAAAVWTRDINLLRVANGVRQKRLDRAWERLS